MHQKPAGARRRARGAVFVLTTTFFFFSPIVSYFVSGGRARCCGERLSPISSLTEILLGALFVLAYINIGLTIALPFFLLSHSVFLSLMLYDLAHQILP